MSGESERLAVSDPAAIKVIEALAPAEPRLLPSKPGTTVNGGCVFCGWTCTGQIAATLPDHGHAPHCAWVRGRAFVASYRTELARLTAEEGLAKLDEWEDAWGADL